MEMTVTQEGDRRLVLACSGRMGWDERDELPQRISSLLGEAERPQVLMDFEMVDFVNSAGIGALFHLAQILQKRDGALILARVPPALAHLFATVGLDRRIRITETLDEARAALDALE